MKILLRYSISFIILVAGNCGNIYGQSILDKKISLQLQHVSYVEILSAVEHAAGVRFIYQPVFLSQQKRIDFTCRQESIRFVLNRLLLPLNIIYEQSYNNTIILIKKEKTDSLTETKQKAGEQLRPVAMHNISGRVISAGYPVIDANIIIAGINRGMAADTNGYFSFDKLAAGDYTIIITHIGYAGVQRTFTLTDEDIYIQVNLAEDVLNMQQVVVTSMGNPKKKIESSTAITTVSNKLLEDRAPVNSADAIKAIPGVYAVSGGGDGPGAVRVRGLPSAGGYVFLGLMEDGLPVLPTGFVSLPSPDQNFKVDLTIKSIEAIRGGNAPLLMANTSGALMNSISYTGGEKAYGKFKITTGLLQGLFRADGNLGGNIHHKLMYNIGGFIRRDKGIRPPSFTANEGGQLKGNLTWNFNTKGFLRIYAKYLNDRVQWHLAGIYPYNKKHRANAFPSFDVYTETLVPSETKFEYQLPEGNYFKTDLQDSYHTKIGYGGFLLSYTTGKWSIKNNFRYQYNDIVANYPFISGALTYDAAKRYYFANGQQLVNPQGYYVTQQINDNRRLESQLINYIDITRKSGDHNLTLGGGIHFYNVIRHEGINAIINTELSATPRVITIDAPASATATAAAFRSTSGHTKYNGLTKISSLYVLNDWTINDKWTGEGGIRMDYFDLSGEKALYSGTSVAAGGKGFSIVGMEPWSHRETKWAASIAANYKANRYMAVFIRATSSYNAANIADLTAVDFGATALKKRTILTGEAGIKCLKGPFSLFSSIAYTRGRNLPQNIQVPDVKGGFISQLTFASSKTWGWETELSYQFLRNFRMRLISTLQQPVFTEYLFTVSNNAREDIAGKTMDWKGNRPQSTPNSCIQLESLYEYKAMNLFSIITHMGNVWSTSANTYKIPAYTELMAGIGVKFFKRHAELRAWSNNLTGTRALTQGNVRGEQFINEKDLVPGQPMLGRTVLPRSFWLSVAYSL